MGDSTNEPTEIKQSENATQQEVPVPASRTVALRNVASSFGFVRNEVNTELKALDKSLREADEPSWIEELLETVVEVALIAGGAGCGKYVVEKLFTKSSREGLAAEFVKTMFEEGVPKGVESARKIARGPHKDNVTGFLTVHEHGVNAMYFENELKFNAKEDTLTAPQATALAEVCSEDNMQEAARAHAEAIRDAWVTYVAYSKYKSMATQEMRDSINHSVPGWTPAQAPTLASSIMHHDVDGVLEVIAHLPDIRNQAMSGTPTVVVALLNGIGEAVREDYANRPLAESRIPRQLTCKVDGDMPDFTLNIDEKGRQIGWLRHQQGAWLRARAAVSNPAGSTEVVSEDAGVDLLLQDLVPTRIER